MKMSFEYAALAPILILLGAGVISVLLEAFLPRNARRPLQLILVFGSIILAFVYVVVNSEVASVLTESELGGQDKGLRQVVAQGSAVIDGPGLFIQGILLIVAFIAALLIAEKHVDPQGDGFASRSSTLPGSEDERAFTAQGVMQTEIWPLYLFSIGGKIGRAHV